MASFNDILTTTQNGVVAVNNLKALVALSGGGQGIATSFVFQDKGSVEAAQISPLIFAIYTLGYSDPGDLGGAHYKRVGAEPAHEGKIQSADGTWWEISEAFIFPQMFGAFPDGNDCSTNFQNALDYPGTGSVWVPAGHYLVASGITVREEGLLRGLITAQAEACIIYCGDNDVIVVNMETQSEIANIQVNGKGSGASRDGSFGASQPAINCGTNCRISDVAAYGGSYCIFSADNSGDLRMYNVQVNQPYIGMCRFGGSTWPLRCTFDFQSGISGGPFVGSPFAAWSAGTPFVSGDIVHTQGYLIYCTVAGTSGGSPPALQNYGIAIPDGAGTLVWQLLAPDPDDDGSGMTNQLLPSTGESHYIGCDFASDQQARAFYVHMVDAGPKVLAVTESVISGRVHVALADSIRIQGCENAELLVDDNYAGTAKFLDNEEGPSTVTIGNNVSQLQVRSNNDINITIGTGCTGILAFNTNSSITNNSTAGVIEVTNL